MQIYRMECERESVMEASLEEMTERYLKDVATECGIPWRDDHAFWATVNEVSNLDEDLKRYVYSFLKDQTKWRTSLGCDVVNIGELVESGGFTPVTASLFVQWYRSDPRSASAFLLQNDLIMGLPDEISTEE